MHLYFPLMAYWKALRTGPLKLQHMLRHTVGQHFVTTALIAIYIQSMTNKAFWLQTLTAVCISFAPAVEPTKVKHVLRLPPGLKKKTTLESLLGLSEPCIVEIKFNNYIGFMRTTATLPSSLYKWSN